MGKDKPQTNPDPQQSIAKKAKKQRKTVIIVLVVVLLSVIIALSAVICFLMSKDKSEYTPSKRDTVVTLDNKDEILADLNNKVAEGMFEVKMNVEWSFEDSSTPSEDAYIANVQTNSNTVYFDVVSDSTGQTLYESPYIPVGSALKNVALQSDLSAGTYPCTLTYHLVDNDKNEVSTLSVAVTLYVLN